jgi:aconitate hydratase
MPFEFTGSDNRSSLNLNGAESITISGLEDKLKPLSEVPAAIIYPDGLEKSIILKCRIDTEVEIEYIQNGGVLHYVLRNLADTQRN